MVYSRSNLQMGISLKMSFVAEVKNLTIYKSGNDFHTLYAIVEQKSSLIKIFFKGSTTEIIPLLNNNVLRFYSNKPASSTTYKNSLIPLMEVQSIVAVNVEPVQQSNETFNIEMDP